MCCLLYVAPVTHEQPRNTCLHLFVVAVWVLCSQKPKMQQLEEKKSRAKEGGSEKQRLAIGLLHFKPARATGHNIRVSKLTYKLPVP